MFATRMRGRTPAANRAVDARTRSMTLMRLKQHPLGGPPGLTRRNRHRQDQQPHERELPEHDDHPEHPPHPEHPEHLEPQRAPGPEPF